MTQRLADLQLTTEQKAVAKEQQKKPQRPRQQHSSGGGDNEGAERPVVTVPQLPTSRSGRQLRRPHYLDSCQL